MMRLYRTLLRLYPASFHREYRDELVGAFTERTTHLGTISRCLAAITDVVPNALAAHWEILRQDLAYAGRSLRRTPGFAITAVLVAAFGIGANTAVFSLADAVFVRPLPYAAADRLVKVWERTPGYPAMELSPANYRDWKTVSTSFVGMAAYTSMGVNLVSATPGSEPRRIEVGLATPELIPLLGVTPLIGRTFTADEAEDRRLVVLSHALWQSQLGGNPYVVGDDGAH